MGGFYNNSYNNFYNSNIFLTNETAYRLYKAVKDMPIYDYHSHISPKEIYEDEVFSDLGHMWLAGDHYKWRLMRVSGIDEEYITGRRSFKEKFLRFAEALQTAVGNPLYHWVHFELKRYFDIDCPLSVKTAEEIWERANDVIREKNLSPKKIISDSNVAYIGTTDDITDDLQYHKKIRERIEQDGSFDTVVAPSFRVDNLLLINRANYGEYIKKLAEASGPEIDSIDSIESLEYAVEKRLDYFKDMGCVFTDSGIPLFPGKLATKNQADGIFKSSLAGKILSAEETEAFIGYMYAFLGRKYREKNMVMQLHLGVLRNCNTKNFEQIGPDCGGDCVGMPINSDSVISYLDYLNSSDALPETIIYTLNPSAYYPLATAAGAFRGVTLGAAWWFCDHLGGINEQLRIFSETLNLGRFYGMLSDSRSFLSYTRHDYFRRILCSFIGKKIQGGEYPEDDFTYELIKNICYNNIKDLINK